MTRLALGTRMRRVSDGREGVVESHEGQPRILFEDRGEKYVAGRSEDWVESKLGALPLRDEEKLIVGLVADRMLRSLVEHVPSGLWRPIDLGEAPYDPALVRVIAEYLGTRAT